MPLLLAIPAWAWLTGGAVIGTAVVLNEAGDAAEKSGDAALKTAELAKWVAAIGAIYVTYKGLKSAGVIK